MLHFGLVYDPDRRLLWLGHGFWSTSIWPRDNNNNTRWSGSGLSFHSFHFPTRGVLWKLLKLSIKALFSQDGTTWVVVRDFSALTFYLLCQVVSRCHLVVLKLVQSISQYYVCYLILSFYCIEIINRIVLLVSACCLSCQPD